ncbi:MAG: biopolymer transporter ExbD [Gammaproteobacteria bacterium]|nr:MAG: biopolymer transporter ExbD [Gammaproteobacteria bacterium]
MKMSRRARRMERHHKRTGGRSAINLVSLMDIFTILVFFLLVNSSNGEVLPTLKSVELPESVAEEKPRETVVVMVTGEDILVHGKVVASIEQVLEQPEPISPQLRHALDAVNGRVLRASTPGDMTHREVTIMGDREIPYRLLKKVMATCTEAGFGRISLAVLQKPLQES